MSLSVASLFIQMSLKPRANDLEKTRQGSDERYQTPIAMIRTRFLISFLLLLTLLATAAGTIESYPEAEKSHRSYLTEARNYLQKEAKGPLETRTLRYRDVLAGEKRTFLWTAQRFENPDGRPSYIMVLTRLLPDGSQELHTAGGFSDLYLAYSDELEPALTTVYDQLNRHIREVVSKDF